MLEAAVGDCAIQFLFQQEIFKASGVDARRTSHPDVVLAGRGALLTIWCRHFAFRLS